MAFVVNIIWTIFIFCGIIYAIVTNNVDVVNNTIYLAKTDNRMELFIKELKMCDISNINSIDFDINIKNDQNGDWIDSFHVHLDVDYPVE